MIHVFNQPLFNEPLCHRSISHTTTRSLLKIPVDHDKQHIQTHSPQSAKVTQLSQQSPNTAIIQTAPNTKTSHHSNPTHCLALQTTLHPTLYFVHISACGLIPSNASGPSKQPANTMTIPLNASASASLLKDDPHSAQKVIVIGKPASWCGTVTFLRGGGVGEG